MRRLTGMLDNVEHVILEHDRGMVEVPSNLLSRLADPDGSIPMGTALTERCRQLFGDSLRILDYAPGELPPETPRRGQV